MGKNKVSRVTKVLGVFAFTVFIWMMGTSARAITFTAQNFEIDFPPGWEAVTPTPAGAIYVSRSPDRSKLVVVNAIELSDSDRSAAVEGALAGAKKNYVDHGLPTDPEQSLTINGVPFRYFTGHSSSANSTTVYAAVAGHELYILALVMKNGEASTDSELQTVLQSFHLLTPAEIPRSADVPKSAAYNLGYQAGRLSAVFLVLVVPAGILVWLVYLMISRQKAAATGRSSAPGTPPPLPPQVPPGNNEESRQ